MDKTVKRDPDHWCLEYFEPAYAWIVNKAHSLALNLV
jgi:hypothetical protein